ncbi:unnamed protein product [Rhizophagus irregularis]|nr:unnamed protein product [Rhizophagus irregularis]
MTNKKVGVRERTSYSIEEKLIVVKYALVNGRNAAARYFDLNTSMIRRWIKQSDDWEKENKKKKHIGSGRKAFYPKAKDKLYKWIIEQRKKGLAVNYTMCIYIRTTGNDKNRFTVVLTCSADSSKYPPICIFKEKQLPRGEVIPKGVICWFQENGWMTSDLMKKYIEFLLRLRIAENLSKEPAMMVYDSF